MFKCRDETEQDTRICHSQTQVRRNEIHEILPPCVFELQRGEKKVANGHKGSSDANKVRETSTVGEGVSHNQPANWCCKRWNDKACTGLRWVVAQHHLKEEREHKERLYVSLRQPQQQCCQRKAG